MPDAEDLGVELPETEQITQAEAEERPDLRADPTKAIEGILEQDPADFQTSELEASEALLSEQPEDAEPGAERAPAYPLRNAAIRSAYKFNDSLFVTYAS